MRFLAHAFLRAAGLMPADLHGALGHVARAIFASLAISAAAPTCASYANLINTFVDITAYFYYRFLISREASAFRRCQQAIDAATSRGLSITSPTNAPFHDFARSSDARRSRSQVATITKSRRLSSCGPSAARRCFRFRSAQARLDKASAVASKK